MPRWGRGPVQRAVAGVPGCPASSARGLPLRWELRLLCVAGGGGESHQVPQVRRDRVSCLFIPSCRNLALCSSLIPSRSLWLRNLVGRFLTFASKACSALRFHAFDPLLFRWFVILWSSPGSYPIEWDGKWQMHLLFLYLMIQCKWFIFLTLWKIGKVSPSCMPLGNSYRPLYLGTGGVQFVVLIDSMGKGSCCVRPQPVSWCWGRAQW